MAITTPRTFPDHTGLASVTFSGMDVVAESKSLFTLEEQFHVYDGQRLTATISLPPMKRESAEKWIAFLLSLRGKSGTFLMGDPLGTALRGTATSCTITGIAGNSTVQATVPVGETLLAGDYIQIGTDASSRLHKVVLDYTGTGAAANLELWPALRTSVSSQVVTLSNCVGVFRRASNEMPWSINSASLYGISFEAVEAL